jgi:transcriptional regulator with XRE-family HTH domain
MITVEQIKAARALLNWNQEVLAEAARISKPALANLESGKVTPRVETLSSITKALEDAGIEFTEGPGVRLSGETLRVLIFEGNDAIFRLWKDQQETLKQGGERLISGLDERMFDNLAGKQRFRQILKKFHEKGITSRLLIKEGDTYFVEPISHYRWVSEELFTQVPYFVYANKYAILLTEPATKVVLIESKPIADSYRKQFNAIWNQAKVPVVPEEKKE